MKALSVVCIFSLIFARGAHADSRIPEPFADSSFPNKDFALHGGPVIGTQTVGANTVIDDVIGNHTGIHISAWATGGFNISNEQTLGGNSPSGYVIDPNQFDLTEAIVRIVRYADTVQKDHIDWGIKVDALYGKDYYMFLSKGLWSNQDIANANDPNFVGKKYGYDIPQFYADVFVPYVADGLNFRAGRILSNPTVYFGRNQLFTHTVFDNNTGDTQTGVIATLKSGNFTYQLGGVNTADVALWNHTDSKLSAYAALQWNAPSQSDSVYLEAYGLNNADYAYHNWQTLYAIWTHKFDEKFYNRLQAAYFYENKVPVLGQGNALGAGNGFAIANPELNNISSSQKTASINGYSLVESVGYSIDEKNYIVGRMEFTSDPEGSLTGAPANYLGGTIGGGHNFSKFLTGTVEMRRDYSFHSAAFDNGAQHLLDLFAASMTVHL